MKRSADLVAALKRSPKDEGTFRQWYEAAYPSLFASAFRLTHGNRALAEDLCQDAVVAFISKGGLAKVNTDAQALSYLSRTIRNHFIDLLRKQSHEASIEAPAEVGDAHALTDALLAAQQLDQLVAGLGPADREILGMMIAGDTLSDIARENGLSYSNAGVRVHRIRNKIKSLRDDV